jgi:hypothetical protein
MKFVDLLGSPEKKPESETSSEETLEIDESNLAYEEPAPMFSFYWMLRFSMGMFMKQFFRDISVLGLHNIPKKGPVIFCGNHNNQFVDGTILFFTANRDVRFMVAAKVSILLIF